MLRMRAVTKQCRAVQGRRRRKKIEAAAAQGDTLYETVVDCFRLKKHSDSQQGGRQTASQWRRLSRSREHNIKKGWRSDVVMTTYFLCEDV